MEINLLLRCSEVYENILDMDLSKVILDEFKKTEKLEFYTSITRISENLKENRYVSIEEFKKNVKETFNKIVSTLGNQNDISWGLLTILMELEERIDKITPISEEEFKERFKSLCDELKQMIEKLPDSEYEYQQLKQANFDKEVDSLKVSLLDDVLLSLDEDEYVNIANSIKSYDNKEQVSKMINYLLHHGSIKSSEECKIEYNISNLPPNTIKLLRNVVHKEENVPK